MKCLNVFTFLILLFLSSCEDYPAPKGELCVATGHQASELACSNTALPTDDQQYFRHLEKSNFCTTAEQYERVRAYCADMRAELIKCKRD